MKAGVELATPKLRKCLTDVFIFCMKLGIHKGYNLVKFWKILNASFWDMGVAISKKRPFSPFLDFDGL